MYPAAKRGSDQVFILRLDGYKERRVRVRVGDEPLKVALKAQPAKKIESSDDKAENKPAVSRSRYRRRWRPSRAPEPEPRGEDSSTDAKESAAVTKNEPAKKPAPRPVIVDEGSSSGIVVDDDSETTADGNSSLVVE
jgi:hypothetical protein